MNKIFICIILFSLGIAQGAKQKTLLELLESNVLEERLSAIRTIKNMGEDSVSILLQVWQSNSLKAKQGAIKLLGEMGIQNEVVENTLEEAFASDHESIRLASIWALYSLKANDKILAIMHNALNDPSEKIRTVAILALMRVENHFSVKEILRLVNDNSPTISFYAQKLPVLTKEETLLELAKVFRENNRELIIPALKVVAQFEQKAVAIVPDIVGLIENSNLGTRYYITDILLKIGEPAVPYLIKALHHDNNKVSRTALKILIRLKGASTAAIPDILEILDSTDLDMKVLAAEALYGLNESSKLPLLNSLEKKLTYWNTWSLALQNISTPRILEIFIAALKNEDIYIQQGILEALCKMGKSSHEVAVALEKILPEVNENIQEKIHKTIEIIQEKNNFDIEKINRNIEKLLAQLNPSEKSRVELSLSYEENYTDMSEDKIGLKFMIKVKDIPWMEKPIILSLHLRLAREENEMMSIFIDFNCELSIFSLTQRATEKGAIPEKIENLDDLYTFLSQNTPPDSIKQNLNAQGKTESIEISVVLLNDLLRLLPQSFYFQEKDPFIKITEENISFQGTVETFIPEVGFNQIKKFHHEFLILLQSGILFIPKELQSHFNEILQAIEMFRNW